MNLHTVLPSFAAAALLSSVAFARSAQESEIQFPQPSPAAKLSQRFGLTDVDIEYSRPSAKGRKIFGGLVPYGEVWRTGANAATKVTFSTDVKIEGQAVPAGTYALMTIPGEAEWTFVVNSGPEQWGTYAYDEKKDVVRVKAKPQALAELVETMTIDVGELTGNSAKLSVAWEKTRASVKIDTDVVGVLVPKIQAAMAGSGKKPYFPSAMFYYENDLDLKQALAWIEEAIKERPDAPWITYRKGLILAKMGDKAGATAAAKEAMAQAEKAGGALGAEYKRLGEGLLASLK